MTSDFSTIEPTNFRLNKDENIYSSEVLNLNGKYLKIQLPSYLNMTSKKFKLKTGDSIINDFVIYKYQDIDLLENNNFIIQGKSPYIIIELKEIINSITLEMSF
jgi:hypothetical protein